MNKFIIACLFVYSTNTREPKCLCCLVCEKAPYVSGSLAKKGKRKEKIKTSSPAYDLGSPVALVCVNISLPACAMELSKTIKVAQSVSLKDRQTEEMKRNQTETSCIAMEMMYRGHTEGFLQTIHPSIRIMSVLESCPCCLQVKPELQQWTRHQFLAGPYRVTQPLARPQTHQSF